MRRLLVLCVLCLAVLTGCGGEAPKSVAEPANIPAVVKTEPVEHGVSVLMYHKVAAIRDNPAVISEENFRAQMQHLKDNGYHPITLAQLADYIQAAKPLPEKPVCITFDDGYADSYHVVYPLLKEYGFPWTLFVITDQVGTEDRVTWDQLREMQAAGVTLGNHTRTHPELIYLDNAQQREEIRSAQERMVRELGRAPEFFCYPYGLYNDDVIAVLQEDGFRLSVTMDPGRVHTGDAPYTVQRIWIGNPVDLEHYEERLTTDAYRSL